MDTLRSNPKPFIKSKFAGNARSLWVRWLALVAVFTWIAGCGTNPVTGKSELQLVSQSQEVNIGKESYSPSQQSQGGSYNVDPQLSRYVQSIGQRLAKVSDRPDLPYEFVVLNNSVPNAWALPGGKIAVNRGLLLELNNEAELAAVLGHEIVHAAARHGAKSMERGMLAQAGIAAVQIAAATQGDNNKYSDYAVGAAALGTQLIFSKYGRDAESESDYFGMQYMAKLGYDAQAAVTLQQTFVRLSKGKSPGWLEGLFASHPPSQERVAKNIETAKKLPAGGRLGEKEYQQAIKTIVNNRQAYQDYEKGRKALSEKNYSLAKSLAEKAQKTEPREALFYALEGDVYLAQSQFKEAVKQFDQAVSKNNAFFYYFRQRGLAKQQLKDSRGAELDLKQSIALLPTEAAHNALGYLAKEQNNLEAAISHFSLASQSPSATGKDSFTQLALLDLPRNPGKYLSLSAARPSQGRFTVEVFNRSPVAVHNIVVSIRILDKHNRVIAVDKMKTAKTIAAGKSIQLISRLAVQQYPNAHALDAAVMSANIRK